MAEVGTGPKWNGCTRYTVRVYQDAVNINVHVSMANTEHEFNTLINTAGPIVRISPWEVHIKDPDWDDIYKLSSKASKPRWYYQSFGTTLSTNTTEAHQLHRARRQALVSWFSSQNIARNTPTVQATIDRLHDRLLASSGRVINMGDVFRSLAIDVASGFAFQRAFNNLDDAEFGRDFNHAVRDYGKTGIVNRHFFGLPFLLMRLMPVPIFNLISPKAGNDFMAVSQVLPGDVMSILVGSL
jgi:hypothetical protein